MIPLPENLGLQLVEVVFSAVAFLITVEGFGYLLIRTLWLNGHRQKALPTADPLVNLAIRIFTGCVIYSMVLFAMGLAGVLSQAGVLTVTLLGPAVALALRRSWQKQSRAELKRQVAENKLLLGCILGFLALTLILWFRPATNFDASWYHLAVPKLMLQNQNLDNQGELIRYSLHPTMTYLWNLFPLSISSSTLMGGMIVNGISAALIGLALAFTARAGRLLAGVNKYYEPLVFLMLVSSHETFRLLGIVGNDLVGMSIGLVAALYAFRLARKPRVSHPEFGLAVILTLGLALIKIFFTFFAITVITFLYLKVAKKLPAGKTPRLMRAMAIGAALFVLILLPWLIRAYYWTGRPLDPVGAPGLNEQVYQLEGGGTARNHWTNYVFRRAIANVPNIALFAYSPLLVLGVGSLLVSSLRKKLGSLWMVATIGFALTFGLSIALQWRYYLAPAMILVLLGSIGVCRLLDIKGSKRLRLLVWVVALVLLPLNIARTIYSPPDKTGLPNISRETYIFADKSPSEYMEDKLNRTYDYYPSRLPPDLTSDEMIFVTLLHNLGYIENPILEPNAYSQDFKGVRTTSDLIAILEAKGIKYWLVWWGIGEGCKAIGISDYENCQTDNNFTLVLSDPLWGVSWYRLAD